MYNFEYYGFSLLCYIQRECNSHFSSRAKSRDKSKVESANLVEVNRVLNYELRTFGDPTASGRPSLCVVEKDGKLSSPGYIDYSRLKEVEELDLVSKWYPEDKKMPQSDIKALGDACYELGLTGVLWQVSQWVPDRKRSALVMIDDSGPFWSRGRIIAASVSDKSFSFISRAAKEDRRRKESKSNEIRDSIIRVRSSEMERLCIRFNEIRLEMQNCNT